MNLGLVQSTRIQADLHAGLSPEFFPLGSSGNYHLQMAGFTGKITQHKRGVRIFVLTCRYKKKNQTETCLIKNIIKIKYIMFKLILIVEMNV